MMRSAAPVLPTACERFDAPEQPASGPVFSHGWLQLSQSVQGFSNSADALLAAVAPQLAALRDSWLVDIMRLYNARNEVWLQQSPIVLRFEDTDVVIRIDDDAGMSVWFGAVETSQLVDDGVYLLQWERAWPFRDTAGIEVKGADIVASSEAGGHPGFHLALEDSELTVFGTDGLTAVQTTPQAASDAEYRGASQAALRAPSQAILASGW